MPPVLATPEERADREGDEHRQKTVAARRRRRRLARWTGGLVVSLSP